MNQKELDNKANLKNPNHWKYWKGRRYPSRPYNWRELIPAHEYDNDDSDSRNNRANQKNPNHISYWKSRGHSNRPVNWRTEIDSDDYESEDEMEATYSPTASVFRSNSNVAVPSEDTSAGSSSFTTLAWIGGGLAVGAGLLGLAAGINRATARENRRRRDEN